MDQTNWFWSPNNSNDNDNNNIGVIVRGLLASLVVVGAVGLVGHVYNIVWLRSERLRRRLRDQGIKGPTPSLLYGNLPEMQKIQLQAMKAPPPISHDHHCRPRHHHDDDRDHDHHECSEEFVAHDYTSTLFPYLEQWRKEYGTLFFFQF